MTMKSTNPPQSFTSNIFKLALPIALQSALVACLALADVLMVSGLGQEATAAVGAASRWHFVAFVVMSGLANAGGSLVAQYWGKGGKAEAKSISVLAVKRGIAIFAPVTLAIALGAELMMSAQSSDALVIALGAHYLWITLPILLLTHIIISVEASMRSSGQTWLPLFLAGAAIGINIMLNHWFIHGGLGLPAMGVEGAAMATTVSRVLQLGMIYWVLVHQRHWLLYQQGSQQLAGLVKSYNKLATPLVLNSLLWASGILLYQVIIGRMGTTELAVFSMLGPFEGLCHSAFFGLAVACSVVVGQSLGQDQFDHAGVVAGKFVRLTLIGSLTLGVFIGLNYQWLLSVLNLDAPELVEMATPAFLVMSAAIWVKMLNLVLINGILRAGGENEYCMRTDFKGMWLVGLPLTAYGATVGGWAFEYVYLAMFSEEIVKLLLSLRHYLRKAWQNNLTLMSA